MSQTDWLDVPADAGTDVPADPPMPDYLKIPELDNPSTGVEVARADAPLKDIRFQVMAGTHRVWACNGRYVACRSRGFNSTTAQRHSRFLASGHYRHVGTFDDVQLFELLPKSPFYREPGDVRQGSFYELLRAAANAAFKRDWRAYVDLLEEIATRFKSSPTGATGVHDADLAKENFLNTLEYLEQLIFMRWYANTGMRNEQDQGFAMQRMRSEIDAGVSNVRQSRGEKPSRTIALPSARPMIIR